MTMYAPRPLLALASVIFFVGGFVAPTGLSAQTEARQGALVVGAVFDSTSASPLVGAAIYLVGTAHITATDDFGQFLLADVRGGEYSVSVRHPRFDSIGVLVPPQWDLTVPDTGIVRVALAIPSMTTLLPGLCPPGTESRGAVLGVVRDAATGTPLPKVGVVFSSPRNRESSSLIPVTVETGPEGRYVACGLPTYRDLRVLASFFRRAPAETVVTLEPDRPVYQDFELEVSEGVPVSGRVVDESTSRPVSGAMVTIEAADGGPQRRFTDADGRFSFDRLEMDTYLVDVEHLAFGKQMRWFTIEDSEPMVLELGLVPDPIELAALVVKVQARSAEIAARSGVRADFVDRIEIERLLPSARNIGDLVRTMPSIRVENFRDPVTGQMALCVEGRRSYNPGCNPVTVVIDGVRSDNLILEQLPPNIIRSIEFIPAVIAGTRYGVRVGSGVLEITTMGAGGG